MPTYKYAESNCMVSVQIMTALAHLPGMGVAGDRLPVEASKQEQRRRRHNRDFSEPTPHTSFNHGRWQDHLGKQARVCSWVPAPELQGNGRAGDVQEQQPPVARQEQPPMGRQVRAAMTCKRARIWVFATGLQGTGCTGDMPKQLPTAYQVHPCQKGCRPVSTVTPLLLSCRALAAKAICTSSSRQQCRCVLAKKIYRFRLLHGCSSLP